MAMRSKEGVRLTRTEEIKGRLAEFYEDLYSSQGPSGDSQRKFLEGLTLPRLSDDKGIELGRAISEDEVRATIAALPLGKAMGPDGYPATFYKRFSHLLVPHLMQLFNSFRARGSITPSMEEAKITLIHKAGKDPEECKSNRPIALKH